MEFKGLIHSLPVLPLVLKEPVSYSVGTCNAVSFEYSLLSCLCTIINPWFLRVLSFRPGWGACLKFIFLETKAMVLGHNPESGFSTNSPGNTDMQKPWITLRDVPSQLPGVSTIRHAFPPPTWKQTDCWPWLL